MLLGIMEEEKTVWYDANPNICGVPCFGLVKDAPNCSTLCAPCKDWASVVSYFIYKKRIKHIFQKFLAWRPHSHHLKKCTLLAGRPHSHLLWCINLWWMYMLPSNMGWFFVVPFHFEWHSNTWQMQHKCSLQMAKPYRNLHTCYMLHT